MIDLRLGDCLDVMGSLPGGSFDLIAADLPFGTTACRWDQIIPFEPLWAHYRRLIKPRGAIVLNASQPFTSMLVMSNPKWFRYEWVWAKSRATGHMNARHRPMSVTESILVFSPRSTTYNPQLRDRDPKNVRRTIATYASDSDRLYGNWKPTRGYNEGRTIPVEKGYPQNLIHFKAIGTFGGHKVHPTQKPVALMEYFIRTYSNEGEKVLDNTMGSGTTLVACLNTERHGIGIESDPAYFAIAERRIAAEIAKHPLLPAVADSGQ